MTENASEAGSNYLSLRDFRLSVVKRIAVMVGAISVVVCLAAPVKAAPTPAPVRLTSDQLKAQGYTKTPNRVAWKPGTVKLLLNKASAWRDIIITGTAPDTTPRGQILTMSRFVPTDTKGGGELKALNINTKVLSDGTFDLHFQLGLVGTYGYSVGYQTKGPTPETVAFTYQFTTTGKSSKKDPGESANPVYLDSKQLRKAGFTNVPNENNWGAQVALTSSSVKKGKEVILDGMSPSSIKAGTVLSLKRFIATDERGSGYFKPIKGATAVVGRRGYFTLGFIPIGGAHGYTVGYARGHKWVGIEFQVTAR